MPALRAIARLLFAVSLCVFAIQHFLYAQFISTLIPAWFPARLFLAYFVGAAFFAAAVAIVSGVFAGLASALLGLMFFLFVITTHVPRIAAHLSNGNEWTSGFVALAMCGGSWIFTGLFPDHSDARAPANAARRKSLPRVGRYLVRSGRIFFAISFLGFAALHLIDSRKTAAVGPPWLPQRPVAAYIIAAVLFAAALLFLLARNVSAPAGLLGSLLLASFLVQHFPRILQNLRNPGPWTSAFEILALGAAALALASLPQNRISATDQLRFLRRGGIQARS